MADASGERKGNVNAAIKVVVRFDDGETRTWAGTGSWGDGLAERYTASREGYRPEGQWIWEGDTAAQRAVATIRVDDNLTGKTGMRPEAWAKEQEKLRAADEKKRGVPGPAPFAIELTVYAKRLDKVTSDPDAEPDEHAPGHVDKRMPATDRAMSSKRSNPGRTARPVSPARSAESKNGAAGGKTAVQEQERRPKPRSKRSSNSRGRSESIRRWSRWSR